MTPYKRGDIVLVPFPFSNQAATKKRPPVVISSSNYNTASPDVIIMAVTSRTQSIGPGECMIMDWRTAGLLKPSAVKAAVSTIEQTLVVKRLGKLSDADLLSTGNALKDLLDLN